MTVPLPRQGEEFRFLHAADLHLGSPIAAARRAGLDDDLRDATYRALDRLVDAAIAHDVAFITLGGDLYDEADQHNPRPQMRLRDALERLTPRPVLVIRGNHDHLGGRLTTIRMPHNVVQFDATKRVHDVGWARIAGASFPTRHVRESMLPQYPPPEPGRFNVGLMHGTVGDPGAHDPYAPCRVEDLLASGYDVWALGHIHKAALLCEKPLVFYPGNIQGRSVRETGTRGAGLVTVDASGRAQMRTVPLHSVLILEEDIDVGGCLDLEGVSRTLRQRVEAIRSSPDAHEGAILRLKLVGRTPAHDELIARKVGRASPAEGLVDAINDELASRRPFALVERLDIETMPDLDLDALMQAEGVLGELARVSRDHVAAFRQILLASQLYDEKELDDAKVRTILATAAREALPRLRGTVVR